jgi:hypothetical protein
MYERADYVQPFNYGGVILKLGVFRPHADAFQGARDFVLLEDLKDHFDLSSTRFEREDGVALTLMRDSHLQRQVFMNELAFVLGSEFCCDLNN